MDHCTQLPERDYCKKPLPAAIDDIARNDPARVWASLPVDDWDLTQGFEDISFRRLARAIDKVAHALDADFGHPSTLQTLAYIGIPDLRYQIAQAAAVKAGYKILLSSPLNSTNIHVSLMKQTDCVALLSAVGVRGIDDILRCRPRMKHAHIAELDELLDDDAPVAPYPYSKSWEDVEHEPYLILHSSGTTADPKPVEFKHMYYGNAWNFVFLPDVNGRTHFHRLTYPGDGTRFLLATAAWHAMSASCSLQMSVFGKGVFCPGYRHRAMATGDVGAFLEHARVQVAALTPWMMEDVARKPNAKEYIEKLDAVLFGGAVLSPLAGSVWSKYTHIQNGWGATEAMATGLLTAEPEDYAYVYFDTKHTGLVFRPSPAEFFDADTGDRLPLYEVVCTMDDDTAPFASWHFCQGLTPANTPRPYPEYRIGDLWTPHPDPAKAAYVFRFVGRTDDTFTLSSASNIHPGPVERAIGAHPRISGVLVVGDQHRQAAALIEVLPPPPPPSPSLSTTATEATATKTEEKGGGGRGGGQEKQEDQQRLAAEIYESVVRPANANMPAHATICQTHMALVPAGAFARTPGGLGKIVRTKTVAKHAALLERMYREHGDQWQAKQGRFNSITATTEIKVEVSESIE